MKQFKIWRTRVGVLTLVLMGALYLMAEGRSSKKTSVTGQAESVVDAVNLKSAAAVNQTLETAHSSVAPKALSTRLVASFTGESVPAIGEMPPPPAPVQALTTIMNEFNGALDSQTNAQMLIKKYDSCVQGTGGSSYQGLQAVCLRNAKLLAEKFPVLQTKFAEIEKKGVNFYPLSSEQMAPPISAAQSTN